MSACTPPGLRLSTACLGMSTCIAYTPPGLRLSAASLEMSACTPSGLKLRSSHNPEKSPAGNPNTGLPLQTRGVNNSVACLGMSACTPPGLRLSTACLGMNTCIAYTPPGLRLSAASLGMSACTPSGLKLRSPQNPEKSPAGNPNTRLPLQTRGGVTNSVACLGMLSEGVVVLKEQNLLIVFKDLACKFCMLHGFKEPTTPESPHRPEEESPTMLTTPEAETDCPWNPEQESPVGNPELLSSQCNCNGSWPFSLHAPDGVLFSPQTEGIQSNREACPWHGAHLNSTL